MFYYTLGRLLFMEDSPAKFKAFIAPFQVVSCTFSLTYAVFELCVPLIQEVVRESFDSRNSFFFSACRSRRVVCKNTF